MIVVNKSGNNGIENIAADDSRVINDGVDIKMTNDVIDFANTLRGADMDALYLKLLTWLLEHQRLVFDCSQIERMDTAVLQTLYAFSKASDLYGSVVSWDEASDVFINNAFLLGLDKGMGVTAYIDEANQSAKAITTGLTVWEIKFNPNLTLLKMGHDPLLIFQTLARLGEFTVDVSDERLPPFSDMEPDTCYLKWNLMLKADVGEQDIRAIFKEVETECELSINSLTPDSLDVDFKVDEIKKAAEIVRPDRLDVQQENDEALKRPDKINAANSILVETEKLETLANLVGELVITQSILSEVRDNFNIDSLPILNQGVEQLKHHSHDMQKVITRIRMRPVSHAFNRLPELVNDLALALGKKVNLKLLGEQIELEKTLVEKLILPLTHLVRNAVDHGIEMPELRLSAGKPETGTIGLNVSSQGSNIIIKVSDDGAGIDTEKVLKKATKIGIVSDKSSSSSQEIHNLIFKSGFSTKDIETNIDGPEIGIEVVRDEINEMGGSIEVASTSGRGTTFTIRLPLEIIEGQRVAVAGQDYIVPLTSIIESIEIADAQVKPVSGKGELYCFRGDYIPVIRLYQLFNLPPTVTQLELGVLVIVGAEGEKAALFVDDLVSQQQVVIKSLEKNYRKVIGFSGATIMGTGKVSLILDILGVMNLYKNPSLARCLIAQGARGN